MHTHTATSSQDGNEGTRRTQFSCLKLMHAPSRRVGPYYLNIGSLQATTPERDGNESHNSRESPCNRRRQILFRNGILFFRDFFFSSSSFEDEDGRPVARGLRRTFGRHSVVISQNE